MMKTARELYMLHYMRKNGEDNQYNVDYTGLSDFGKRISTWCRSGKFKSAQKIGNQWQVDEAEYLAICSQFEHLVASSPGEIARTLGFYNAEAQSATPSSANDWEDSAKFIGGAIGVVIAIIMIVGFLKIVAGAQSQSTYTSPRSSGAFGGYSSQAEFENAVRDAANALYDKCQIYGSSYDERCN